MTAPSQSALSVVALAGGVGGARLVDGLDRTLPPGSLTVVVNTGDDFQHWGLHISPDLDTVMYTLAGLSPEDRGWGIAGDTFQVLEEAKRRGVDEWFQLGDRDLVTHLSRSGALARGVSLTRVTAELCKTLGVERPILPMTDAPRPTSIVTQAGKELVFQEWLVKARAAPAVREVRHQGTDQTTHEVLAALTAADLVVICPSNPYVSIDPILTLSRRLRCGSRRKGNRCEPNHRRSSREGPACHDDPRNRRPRCIGRGGRNPLRRSPRRICGAYGDAFDAPYPLLETNILIQSREDRVVFARELIEFARSLR